MWEQLDRQRLADVPLVHVRGHSGDADNDRCDAIAVAFARGQRPQLASEGRPAAAAPAAAAMAPPAEGSAPAEPAPAPLQALLTRLELAERLAQGGFALTLLELAQLVEMPLRTLESRSEAWTWRDWRVQPAGEGRWRLERDAGGLEPRA